MAIGVALLASCVPANAAPRLLEFIGTEGHPTNAQVTIRLSRPTTYAIKTLPRTGDHPFRVYIDLDETKIGPTAIRQRELTTGPLLRVRTGQFTRTQVRVVLDLRKQTPYSVTVLHAPFRIVLGVGKRTAHADRQPQVFAATPQPARTGSTNATPQTVTAKRPPVAPAEAKRPGPRAPARDTIIPDLRPRYQETETAVRADTKNAQPAPQAAAGPSRPVVHTDADAPDRINHNGARTSPLVERTGAKLPVPVVHTGAQAPTPTGDASGKPPHASPTSQGRPVPASAQTLASAVRNPTPPGLPHGRRRKHSGTNDGPRLFPPRVVIDPGHGGRDPGAQGVGGVWEKDVALALSHLLSDRIRQRLHVGVAMTRKGDETVSLQRRAAYASGTDLLISIHANSCPETWVNGVQTFYVARGHHGPESQRLARLVHGRVVRAIDADYGPVFDGGVRERSLGLLRRTRAPSLLLEPAYLSNPADVRRLADPDYRLAVIDGIVDGIADFLSGLSYPRSVIAGARKTLPSPASPPS